MGEYLEFLEQRGVSCNVASFVGSSTLRIHAMGYEDRAPTPQELDHMRSLLHQAMREGAVGLSAALIYPPATYSQTDELIALAKVVAEHDGMYISHIRSEGWFFEEAVEELIRISREAKIRAEIYHLKAAGRENWGKMDTVIQRIEAARAAGLPVTADMYLYPAGGTGLSASLPPWAHEGGNDALLARLKDPETRARIVEAMRTPSNDWENMWLEVEFADQIVLAGFKTAALKPLTGKTLAEIAAARGTSPEDTAIDLLIEDGGRIFTLYFTMSEDNIRQQVQLPYLSFCSDAELMAAEGLFLKRQPHPRAYGNFARLLGTYVRDLGLVTLEDAIRRLTALPAANLKLHERGALKPGYLCRRGRLRPGDHSRSRDLRPAAPVRHRDAARLRQRAAGDPGWRAHRRDAGAGRARSRLGRLAIMTRRQLALIIIGLIVLVGVALVGVSVIYAPEASTVETADSSCADCLSFPVISGENLLGEVFTLPADFVGNPVLVIVPFDETQQRQAAAWLPLARELAAAHEGFAYYDVPVFPDTAAPFKVVIRAGLNVVISDPALQAVTITVFLEDRDPFLTALDLPDATALQAFLLDASHNVIWRGSGAYTDDQGASLRAALDT